MSRRPRDGIKPLGVILPPGAYPLILIAKT